MNPEKTGRLIHMLRLRKKMTQKQLADAINVTDKAICKWEKGHGCPDATLLVQLSKALEIDVQSLMQGCLPLIHSVGGTMNNLYFYRCPTCGNLITAQKNVKIDCCSNPLSALTATSSEDERYRPIISEFDGQYSVSFKHPMTKEDFIAHVIAVRYDQATCINLFAEQEAIVTLPQISGLRLFVVTNQDELVACIL